MISTLPPLDRHWILNHNIVLYTNRSTHVIEIWTVWLHFWHETGFERWKEPAVCRIYIWKKMNCTHTHTQVDIVERKTLTKSWKYLKRNISHSHERIVNLEMRWHMPFCAHFCCYCFILVGLVVSQLALVRLLVTSVQIGLLFICLAFCIFGSHLGSCDFLEYASQIASVCACIIRTW